MKKMKKIHKIYVLIMLGLFSLTFQSCKKDFDGIDDDPNQITDKQLEADLQIIGSKFKPVFENIYEYSPLFQLQQNLNADIYGGYLTPPRPFRAGQNNNTYNLVGSWNNHIWVVAYSRVMNNLKKIEELKDYSNNFYAVSLILKVEAMHRVSDIFGPIVYSNFGQSSTSSTYDSQEEAYNQFFADLDEAQNILSQDIDGNKFTKFDMVYGGDYHKWMKFANSLRLRLAIRIAMVDPAKAKLEGEKALANSEGLIESNSESFIVKGNLTHPLKTICCAWNDTRMNASLESFMRGYNDPRLPHYFKESTVSPGEIKGIRGGLPLMSNYTDELAQKADYVGFSTIGDDIINSTYIQLMTAAEVWFLKAEAALRGWNGAGNAQTNYETGISKSFSQYGVGDAAPAYISDNTSTPMNYVDPVNNSNNINALTNVTIVWDNSASNEEKLEKIITQKWIAMFPEGMEAWSEFRRTGYPKLFPVVSNQSGGTIDTNIQIRRLPFVISEYSTNPDGVAGAVTKLGGPDNGGTRLWWDTGSNF